LYVLCNWPLPPTLLQNRSSAHAIRVNQHQKGKAFWILMKQEKMGWQRHQLDHMQINRSSLRTDKNASTHHSVFYKMDALPATQQTVSKH